MKFIPLVGGALLKNGKLLVLKRSQDKNYYAGKWEIPGGKIEFGEEPEKTITREFKEETGLDITIDRLFHAWQASDHVTKVHFLEVDYIVKCENTGEVKLNKKEHSEFKWIEKAEEVDCTPEMKKTIQKALELVDSKLEKKVPPAGFEPATTP